MVLTLPSESSERLRFMLTIDGVLDSTDAVPIYTALDPLALRKEDGAPTSDWQLTEWFDDFSVNTHLLTGYDPGRYGLWCKVAHSDEVAIVFIGQVVLT